MTAPQKLSRYCCYYYYDYHYYNCQKFQYTTANRSRVVSLEEEKLLANNTQQPLTLSLQASHLCILQIVPTVAFPFLLLHGFPGLFTNTSDHIHFHF